MKLQTGRLTLVELSMAYLKQIHQLHSLEETIEFNTLPIPETVLTTELLLREWIAHRETSPRTSYTFCIKLKITNQFVGLIALNLGKPGFRIAEVWYKILPEHWRNGYTTEALREVLKFGFHDLKLHRIEAGCAVENIASSKVLEKSGMSKEGTKRRILPIKGRWLDASFYSILDEEFERDTL